MFKTKIVLCGSSYGAAYLVIQMALGNSPLGKRVLSRDLHCLALTANEQSRSYTQNRPDLSNEHCLIYTFSVSSEETRF